LVASSFEAAVKGDDLSHATLPEFRDLVHTLSEAPECPDRGAMVNTQVSHKLRVTLGLGRSLFDPPKGPVLPFRPELFKRCSTPWILRGRQDVASLIYYGGLSSTGYAWRDIASKIFERCGYHTEVHSLAGHDGVWAHFRDTGHRQWVNDIVERSRGVSNPIFLGYSTSALAAIVAAGENPGLFKAIILVAPPLQLKSSKYSLALTVSEFMCSHFPNKFRWLEQKCVAMGGDRKPELLTKQTKRSPYFEFFPAPVVFSLKRLQREAIKVLKKIDIPVLVLQGEHDGTVASNVPDMILSRIKSQSKQQRIFPRSGHSLLLGLEKKEVLQELCGWLRNTALAKDTPPEGLPDFKTRRSKIAVAGHVMGTIWERFRQLSAGNRISDVL
jgi:esterase/lipase